MNKYRLVPIGLPTRMTTAVATADKIPLPNSDGKWDDLVELFPPRLRNKARLILAHLKGRIHITDDNRIVYLDGENEESGSSIYDLIKFFITPQPPNASKQTRPPDALRFGKLLKDANVPVAAYAFSKSKFVDDMSRVTVTKNGWKRLY